MTWGAIQRRRASALVGVPLLLGCGLAACDRPAPVTQVSCGQEREVARLAGAAPYTAPPRRGGFMDPPETGRQIRA